MSTRRVVLLAALLVGLFSVSGSDAATCARAATGECLNLEARDYAFSADSKSLILSYQYRSGGRALSPVVTAKIDLETLSPGRLPGAASCSTYLSEPRVSPDGKRIAFVNRGAAKDTDSMIVVIDATNGEAKNIPAPAPYSFKSGRTGPKVEPHPFFSPDGKYLHFTSFWSYGSLIRTYDLDALAYVDFSTKQPFAPDNKEPGLFVPVMSTGPMTFDATTNSLLFIGVALNLPKDLLGEYAEAAKMGRSNINVLRLLMTMNIREKALKVSAFNQVFLDDLKAGRTSLGFGWLRLEPDGRAYALKDGWKSRSEKKVIFEYVDGKIAPFLTLEAQPLVYDFATPAYIFALSPDKKWVAYTYQTNMGSTDGTDVLVIENVETHETRIVDLNGEAFRNFSATGRC